MGGYIIPNVFDVANYILFIFDGNISKFKLQQLCYYAQAWHLAFNGQPLFDEDFLRLDIGPICYPLWKKFNRISCKGYKKILRELLTDGDMKPYSYGAIDYALENYGEMDVGELSYQTHWEDPWRETAKNGIIDKDLIGSYYFRKRRENDSSDDDEPVAATTQKKTASISEETQNGPTYPRVISLEEMRAAVQRDPDYIIPKAWKVPPENTQGNA
jgi:uncharacterized phage-associated protein